MTFLCHVQSPYIHKTKLHGYTEYNSYNYTNTFLSQVLQRKLHLQKMTQFTQQRLQKAWEMALSEPVLINERTVNLLSPQEMQCFIDIFLSYFLSPLKSTFKEVILTVIVFNLNALYLKKNKHFCSPSVCISIFGSGI